MPLLSMADFYEIANFVSVHRFHVAGIAGLLAFWIWIRPHRRRRLWSSRIESSLLLLIPGPRGLVARQNLASIAHVLGQLLRAGLPLEQALKTVAEGDLHPLYRRWVTRVRASILNGNSLADSCAGARRLVPLPGSFVSLLSMGETHNNLENALSYTAEHYQQQVERRKRVLLGAVLPAGVLLMGYITLSIEVAVFQAMIDLADAIIP